MAMRLLIIFSIQQKSQIAGRTFVNGSEWEQAAGEGRGGNRGRRRWLLSNTRPCSLPSRQQLPGAPSCPGLRRQAPSRARGSRHRLRHAWSLPPARSARAGTDGGAREKLAGRVRTVGGRSTTCGKRRRARMPGGGSGRRRGAGGMEDRGGRTAISEGGAGSRAGQGSWSSWTPAEEEPAGRTVGGAGGGAGLQREADHGRGRGAGAVGCTRRRILRGGGEPWKPEEEEWEGRGGAGGGRGCGPGAAGLGLPKEPGVKGCDSRVHRGRVAPSRSPVGVHLPPGGGWPEEDLAVAGSHSTGP